MRNSKSLKVLSVAVPTLLVAQSFGSYSNVSGYAYPSSNWATSQNASGYTYAEYSGPSTPIQRRGVGWSGGPNDDVYLTGSMTSTFVTASVSWSSTTHSDAYSRVYDLNDPNNFVDNGTTAQPYTGANSRVYNSAHYPF